VNDDGFDVSLPDPAFDRLRGADPAGDATPDLVRLRAAVDGRIAATPVDELATRRAGRTRWYVGAAAIAAGAIIVGSGGFALGNVASGQSSSTSLSKTMVDGYNPMVSNSAARPVTPSHNWTASGPTNSRYAGKLNNGLVATAPGLLSSHTIFAAAASLSTNASTAEAYAFAPASVDVLAKTNDLATAFGLPANAALSSDGSQYVAGTATNALYVGVDSTLSFRYFNEAASGACVVAGVTKSGNASSGSPGAPVPPVAVQSTPVPQPSCATPTGATPTTTDALSVSKKVMTDVGVDPATYEWSAQTSSGSVSVTASLKLSGQSTDAAWSFTVGADNAISDASGSLAPTVSLGSYAVVSPKDAVARLNDPLFGSTNFGGPVVPMAGAAFGAALGSSSTAIPPTTPSTTSPSAAPSIPTTPSAGALFSWPVTTVTIVKADLGLAQYQQASGATVLLPTYALTGSDSATYAVLALDAAALKQYSP